MKKLLSTIIIAVMLLSTTVPVYASEVTSCNVEEMSVSEALSSIEIVDYLKSSGELDALYQVQEEIRNCQYETTAMYAREILGISDLSASDVQFLSDKYNLQLPCEDTVGIVDNGTVYVQRNTRGDIIDIWSLHYVHTDYSFSVLASMIDADNPLDLVTGELKLYYLRDTTWAVKSSDTFEKSNVKNGTVYTWSIPKWGVKERFEYNINVTDNGATRNFNNTNVVSYTRYNFDAKPYNQFTPNGGQRHHFIPAAALRNNGFDANSAYCIRMMTADHYLTGSYGSYSYVSDTSNLLSNGRYEDALQKEVNDLKSKMDCEGIAGNLQQKYYTEVVTCLYEYEKLFNLR